MGLRPQVSDWQLRQGARRGPRKGVDYRRHEAGLEGDLPVREAMTHLGRGTAIHHRARIGLLKQEDAMTARPIIAFALAGVMFMGFSSSLRAQAIFSPARLAEGTVERRAVEAVNWGMPA